jgi:hypothetical protein
LTVAANLTIHSRGSLAASQQETILDKSSGLDLDGLKVLARPEVIALLGVLKMTFDRLEASRAFADQTCLSTPTVALLSAILAKKIGASHKPERSLSMNKSQPLTEYSDPRRLISKISYFTMYGIGERLA